MRRAIAIALSALATTAQAVSAPAYTTSELQMKIRSALRAAPSFVETVAIKPQPLAPLGGALTYTVVAPNRFHQVSAGLLGGSDDTIVVGHEIYGHKGQGWTVQTWTDALVTGFEGDIFDVDLVSVGPGKTVDGKTVGSFEMKNPFGQTPPTLTCTYDEATFRPLSCTNGTFAVQYSKYGDPDVTVEAPKNAVRLDK